MKNIPNFKSDKEAEEFLEQDLSDLDFSQFKPISFEFKNKDTQVNMRFPSELLDAVKIAAAKNKMPYQRFIRKVLERAVR
jgi:predicted DNA binding CopG/RHH family protein